MSIGTSDADIAEAVRRSSLADLPLELIDRLMDGGRLHTVSAGTTIHQGAEPPFFDLIVSGLCRAYVVAPDGRTMTVRYCRPGSLMGTGTAFNRGAAAQGCVSAVVDSRLFAMRPTVIRELARVDVRVANSLLRETSARVADYINELQSSAMASVRQRLARHLLDLASEQQTGHRLAARVSQEELASAAGTVREIVVRMLRDMREEGLVVTRRGEVELVDPESLVAEAYHRS